MSLYIRIPYPPLPTLVGWGSFSFRSISEAHMCQCRGGQKGHSLLLHTLLKFSHLYLSVGFLDWNHTLLRSGAGGAVFQLLNKILSHLTIETSLSKALARWIRSPSSRLLIKLDEWVGSRTIVPLSLLYLPPLPPQEFTPTTPRVYPKSPKWGRQFYRVLFLKTLDTWLNPYLVSWGTSICGTDLYLCFKDSSVHYLLLN